MKNIKFGRLAGYLLVGIALLSATNGIAKQMACGFEHDENDWEIATQPHSDVSVHQAVTNLLNYLKNEKALVTASNELPLAYASKVTELLGPDRSTEVRDHLIDSLERILQAEYQKEIDFAAIKAAANNLWLSHNSELATAISMLLHKYQIAFDEKEFLEAAKSVKALIDYLRKIDRSAAFDDEVSCLLIIKINQFIWQDNSLLLTQNTKGVLVIRCVLDLASYLFEDYSCGYYRTLKPEFIHIIDQLAVSLDEQVKKIVFIAVMQNSNTEASLDITENISAEQI